MATKYSNNLAIHS